MTNTHPTSPSIPAIAGTYADLLPRVFDAASAYLESLPNKPVVVPDHDDEVREVLGGALPLATSDAGEVLSKLLRGAELGIVPSGSPRYFGYVVGGVLPIALAADWLTSLWDQCGIVHDVSPLTAVLEETTGRWLVELFRLPTATQVSFTPSCTYANLVCLAAARHGVLRRHGWNVENQGLQNGPLVTVLASASSHAAITRSLRVLGLGGHVEKLATDPQGRIRLDALNAAIDRIGIRPFIVCAQVGEVNTGAVDDVEALAAKVHSVGGWLHLDGAFGLWAAATERRDHLLRGLDQADSWATDAHKWLNVPYDSGIAFIADSEAHREAVEISPDYLHQDNPDQRHSVKWGLNISQRSRVIPVWAALAQLGRDGIAAMIDEHCALAQYLAALLTEEPGIEVVNEIALNQVAVRFTSTCVDDDTHTQAVAQAFQHTGTGWASTSRWNGRAILRISIVNWATSKQDIERTAEALVDCHRQANGASTPLVAGQAV